MPLKKHALVDFNRCVACGACTKVCPRKAISVRRGCYAVASTALCIGCGKCEKICPVGCITMKTASISTSAGSGSAAI